MRLVRKTRSPEGKSLLVGEAPPPGYGLEPDTGLTQRFIETYVRLQDRLVDHAERFVGRDDAQDAVGDAMTSLWIQWPTLSHEKRTDAYIFGIVSHCVSAKRRENSKLVSLEDAESELDQLAANALPVDFRGDSVLDVLDAALAVMSARRREVLLLVREQSFTRRQAAQALGLSEGTINTHMYLAMDDLRTAFKRAGYQITNAQLRQLPAPKGGDSND